MRRQGRPPGAGCATGDEGSILLLAIAACALGLAVVFLVSAASSLYLERDRLYALADAAALAGAEFVDVDVDAAAGSGSGTDVAPRLHLTDEAVARTVAGFIADEPTTGLDELRIDGASTPDGRSARVALSATWHPPFTSLFVPDGVRLDATSTARGVLVGPGGAAPGPAGGG